MDYNNAKVILAEFGIGIETKGRKGIKIFGNEHDIRTCLNYERFFFVHANMNIEEEYSRIYFPSEDLLEKLKRIVINYQDSYSKTNLSDSSVAELANSLYIASKRIELHHFLDYDEDTQERFLSRNSFYTARIICENAKDILKCDFSNNDCIFVTIFIVANRVMLKSADFPIREGYLSCKESSLELVQYLEKVNNFQYLGKDLQLAEDISLILTQVFTRMEYHFKSTTYLYNQHRSLMSKKMAIQAAKFINEKFHIKLDEEEIFLFSLIIYPTFGRYPFKFKSARSIVISHVNKSVAKCMTERLIRNFGERIERYDVLCLYELADLDLSQYDFLFTSYPRSVFQNLPGNMKYEYVDVNFDELAKERLRSDIVGKIYQHPFPKDVDIFIHRDVSVKDKNECLEYISEIIEKERGANHNLLTSLRESEKYSPSKDFNNLVFITPLEGYTPKASVEIFVLKKSIQWYINKAQIVVYWDNGLRKDEATRFENDSLPHLLDITISDEEVINLLLKGDDPVRMKEQLWKKLKEKEMEVYLNSKNFK
jgi:lichenan operon transcriptional antiterminator